MEEVSRDKGIGTADTRAFCTVITADYLHYALTLNESLLAHSKAAIPLYILDVHSSVEAAVLPGPLPENVVILHLSDLIKERPMAKKIQETYAQEERGMLRWALKSVLMQWVLERHELCFYCDNDLYFHNDYGFLWEELSGASVLLSPHWRSIEPNLEDPIIKRNIELTYMHGLYNAGFIGASRRGLDFLQWWSRCCLSYKELQSHQGIYVDQTFLNVVPLNFESVRILAHRGCNISAWNYHTCLRSLDSGGQVLINERYPLVFTHFAWGYDQTFGQGDDLLIAPLWGKWKERLESWSGFSQPFQGQNSISFGTRVVEGLKWRFYKGLDGFLAVLGLQRKQR